MNLVVLVSVTGIVTGVDLIVVTVKVTGQVVVLDGRQHNVLRYVTKAWLNDRRCISRAERDTV